MFRFAMSRVHACSAVIVGVKMYLVPVHFRLAHGRGGEVCLHSFANSALDEHESSDSHPVVLSPEEKESSVSIEYKGGSAP